LVGILLRGCCKNAEAVAFGQGTTILAETNNCNKKEQIRYFCRTIHYEQKNAELDERSGNKI